MGLPLSDIVLFLAVFVTLGSGNFIKLTGECPQVPVLRSFDVNKFLGDWYVIQRYHPRNTCTKINIKKDDDGSYVITEYSRPLGISFLTFGRLRRTSRKIHFPSNNTDAIIKVHRGISRFPINTYGVVDTDYSEYAILWGCDSLILGTISNADIWSRNPTLDAKIVENARLKLKELKLDIHALKNVPRERCTRSSERGKDKLNNMYPGNH